MDLKSVFSIHVSVWIFVRLSGKDTTQPLVLSEPQQLEDRQPATATRSLPWHKPCKLVQHSILVKMVSDCVASRIYGKHIYSLILQASTYDHRVWKTGLPVRSAVLKPHAGRVVVGWVTTSESLLLYVFLQPLFFCVT
ncbi:hypothetical protein BO86DRAFT_250047 [Aspergillus japonicus CBS 114.51]|uniref:Uncharacterized protein n=1 Tax=Aspergillus japonicus CBS 114.51 TaxID=1448312 RepID=A0A8T8WLE0_ASPJA|nr:hypothetical protein BO86DRAFT_250047 [Aspergillus japonicus CBS 114.51]RAH76504.1 hypothetical protein BO86DRAFT_250047 [Aspergillus japonicus CBS 114.51]